MTQRKRKAPREFPRGSAERAEACRHAAAGELFRKYRQWVAAGRPERQGAK